MQFWLMMMEKIYLDIRGKKFRVLTLTRTLTHNQEHNVLFFFSLLQERMEMARMAEEVARQTAEMAIRQMASEGQSIKLSLGSQELLEEPEVE